MTSNDQIIVHLSKGDNHETPYHRPAAGNGSNRRLRGLQHTHSPKGVYFSHRQLVTHTLASLAALGTASSQGRFHRGDVYMPITPMFHVHAWGIPYMATVLGVKQVYPGRYDPAVLLGLVQKEKVTFSHCVPTILHMILSSPAAQTVDLSAWKLIIGGSALPKALC